MSQRQTTSLIYRFGYYHYQTDGKLQNMMEALEPYEVERVCLSPYEPSLDGVLLDRNRLTERLTRVRHVIRKLRRKKIAADLILPGLGTFRPTDAVYKRYIRTLYRLSAIIGVEDIWVDDTSIRAGGGFPRRGVLNWYAGIRRAVHSVNSKIKLGFRAAYPQHYQRCNLTAVEIAQTLAGMHQPRLIQSQPFLQDCDRTDILSAADTLATSIALNSKNDSAEIIGSIDHKWACSFHKSAESDQMQMNLNALFGMKTMMVDCFDKVGTAPGADNLYLQMHHHNHRFLKKLAKMVPENPLPSGVRVIEPAPARDIPRSAVRENPQSCWPTLLWRMGLPVSVVAASSLKPNEPGNPVYVLTGNTPEQLSRRQFNHIFKNGVLLDAQAAQSIQKMGLPGLLGVKVSGPIKNVQMEILSDQTFAAPYYGYKTVWADHLAADDFRLLKPFHNQARVITTLNQKNRIPITNGMVLFDNTEHNHRCAILPYSLQSSTASKLLSVERQRHLRDVLAWLLRRRLDCFVENTPDLVLFYLPDPQRKRMIIALLNVGFDWALDARIRLGQIPFTVKRVRELNDKGKLVAHPKLNLHISRDYQYLQLTSDTAVPPMQMTVLLLEG